MTQSARRARYSPLSQRERDPQSVERRSRIERTLSKALFPSRADLIERSLTERCIRDTHYSKSLFKHRRCYNNRCSHLQIPFSNLRLDARVEGEKKKEKNSRETSIIPSIYLCKGRRRTMALMAKAWALNRFVAVSTSLTNALRRARSASWSSVATLFFAREKERKREGRVVLRYTLRKER